LRISCYVWMIVSRTNPHPSYSYALTLIPLTLTH
jgi:hypothetical protein